MTKKKSTLKMASFKADPQLLRETRKWVRAEKTTFSAYVRTAILEANARRILRNREWTQEGGKEEVA